MSDSALSGWLSALLAFVALGIVCLSKDKPNEAVVVADRHVSETIEKQQEQQSNTLSVSRSTSTIVFVGDAQSEYGRKWLSNEATQCDAKGWQIKTVDLSGMEDPKFFIYSGGQWKIHNGHLSLSSLSALVSRTTATQSQSTGPLPSVAPRRADP